MGFNQCDPGYECVSSVYHFGVGHTDHSAKERIATSQSAAHATSYENLQSIGGDGATTAIYEQGCPFKGKTFGRWLQDRCMEQTNAVNISLASTGEENCSWCWGFSNQGYDTKICDAAFDKLKKTDGGNTSGPDKLYPCLCVLRLYLLLFLD